MLVKKLAVPLINDKILNQAEYCYIATAAISDTGFDFIRSRIPPKCKMELLTGLDVVTSPGVLKRIWKHYQERILLRVHTRSIFHANLYIFDLPFRKSVAFVGSGQFTLEGLKDNEEIFEKITDPKEIEALKSWFIGHYEYAESLTEEIINGYDLIYPSLKQREIASRKEKREMMEMASRTFTWDGIKFKNQYFKKEDYLILSNANSFLQTPEIIAERTKLQQKLNELGEQLSRHISFLKLQLLSNPFNQNAHSLSISFGRRDAELKKISEPISAQDFMTITISIRQKEVCIALNSEINSGKNDREYFRVQMNNEEYKTRFFQLLTGLGTEYRIEIFGEEKEANSFQNEDVLGEFIKADDWRYYALSIAKSFSPGDGAISIDGITPALEKELDRLVPLMNILKVSNKGSLSHFRTISQETRQTRFFQTLWVGLFLQQIGAYPKQP